MGRSHFEWYERTTNGRFDYIKAVAVPSPPCIRATPRPFSSTTTNLKARPLGAYK